MGNLLIILLFVFAGVAAMVVLGDRFGKPQDPEKMARIQRWIMPAVGLMLVLSAVKFFLLD